MTKEEEKELTAKFQKWLDKSPAKNLIARECTQIAKKYFENKELYEDILLDVEIKVNIEMAFINLITELGYREDKMWTPEEQKTLDRLMELADEFSKDLLDMCKNHKNH